MLNVRGNLNNNFFAQKYDCLHRSQEVNNYGENVLTESSFIITASIQPTTGKELEFLPESAILTETITVFSKELLDSQMANGYGDIVIYGGKRYQVVKSLKWKTHCESFAVLEGLSE